MASLGLTGKVLPTIAEGGFFCLFYFGQFLRALDEDLHYWPAKICESLGVGPFDGVFLETNQRMEITVKRLEIKINKHEDKFTMFWGGLFMKYLFGLMMGFIF